MTALSAHELRRALLVGIVAEHGPIPQADLLAAAGLSQRDHTSRRALADAAAAGRLARDDAGRYRLACAPADTPPPTDPGRALDGPQSDRQAVLAMNRRLVAQARALTTDHPARKDPDR